MKQLLSVILVLSLLCACLPVGSLASASYDGDAEPVFYSVSDPALLQYVSDMTLASLQSEMTDERVTVESVQAIYISQEYLDELAYNSRANIFFGYTLEELEARFAGTKYVFTLGNDHTTVVEAFTPAETPDTSRLIRNVAIGGGVILVLVVVTVATGGATAPETIQIIHAVAAEALKHTVKKAAVGAAMGAYSAGMLTYRETGDWDQSLNSALEGATEGFAWGAVVGAVEGITQDDSGSTSNPLAVRKPQASVEAAMARYDGVGQTAFLNGSLVAFGAEGAVYPDIWIAAEDGTGEAIQVKNYQLSSGPAVKELTKTLLREVTERAQHLPHGSTQRIVLDVYGRGYSDSLITMVVDNLKVALWEVYPNIPIDILRD